MKIKVIKTKKDYEEALKELKSFLMLNQILLMVIC